MLAVCMYGLWSSVFALGKGILAESSFIFVTGIRMLLAGFLLLLWLGRKDIRALKVKKTHILPLFLFALFGMYLNNVLELWGLQYLSSAKTCFIYGLTPFFSAMLSYIHFSERMNVRKCLGMIIGFMGFLPVLLLNTDREKFFQAFSIFSWPELAIMATGFISAYGWVILRIMVKELSLSSVYTNGYAMLLGGVFGCLHSFCIDSWHPLPIVLGREYAFIKSMGLIIIISNIICYNMYGWMLKKFTATFLSCLGLLSPIFASLSGWIWLGESISWVILASTLIICLGLFLVYQEEFKQGYVVSVHPTKSVS